MSECVVCGQAVAPDDECDICSVALRDGVSVEEVRLDVEQLAFSMTARFASAEGKPCTCGAGPGCVPIAGPKRRGRGGMLVGYVTFDVRHEHPCPRAPAPFDWPPVDEARRREVFGYDGREHHMGRLLGALRELHDDRMWLAE